MISYEEATSRCWAEVDLGRLVKNYHNALNKGLGFARFCGGDDDALCGGYHAQGCDGKLTSDDDGCCPDGHNSVSHKDEQGAHDQQLVGQGIHQLAEVGDEVVFSCDLAVDHKYVFGQINDSLSNHLAVTIFCFECESHLVANLLTENSLFEFGEQHTRAEDKFEGVFGVRLVSDLTVNGQLVIYRYKFVLFYFHRFVLFMYIFVLRQSRRLSALLLT